MATKKNLTPVPSLEQEAGRDTAIEQSDYNLYAPRKVYTHEEIEEIKRRFAEPAKQPNEAMMRTLETYKRLIIGTRES